MLSPALRALLASAMILVPLASGMVFFKLAAPEARAGVYVCAPSCDSAFRLSAVAQDGSAWQSRAARAAAIVPDRSGTPTSFLIVSPDRSAMAAPASLYVFVVDRHDPQWADRPVEVPTRAHQLNPRIRRIDVDEEAVRTLGRQHYRDVVERTPVARSHFDVMLGLQIAEGSAESRIYPLRVEPR